MISITQDGSIYSIKSKYDPFLISVIKNVPGRQWVPDKKVWTVPSEHLGWLLNELKGTVYENAINIQSTEHINENASIDPTSTSQIPDIDISDMHQYVEQGGSLYPHQIDFLKYAKGRNGKGFILADEMGCVTGDTIITLNTNGKSEKISLEKFYRRFHKLNKNSRFDKHATYRVRCLREDKEIFALNTVQNVLYSGEKEVYKLTLSDGKTLKATADHEICTPNGYVELQNLSVGDYTIVYDANAAVRAATVTGVEYVGIEPTYDIVMADPYRNFVANDIVVHNCGKTLEVMNYALYQRDKHNYKHCLIICCVNSAKYSWQDDIQKHTNNNEQAYILGTRKKRDGSIRYNTTGADKLKDLETGHMYGDNSAPELPYFIITNIESLRTKVGKKYAIAQAIIDMAACGSLQMIAIDEVHKNMSPKSTQGKLILEIKKKTGLAIEWIPMTGTPIINKPTDVFTPLRLVNGHSVKSYYMWCQQFIIYGGYGDHEVMGYKNIPQLKDMLQVNMLRRLKKDVLYLPPKIYYTEYVENTPIQTKLYMDVQQGLYDRKEEILQSMNPLAEMLKLRQVNGSPELIDESIQVDDKYLTKNAKLTRLLELIDDIVERGEKVVVFSNWVAPLKTIYRFVAKKYKTTCFTGTMTEEDRQKHKRVFINNPEYKIMLGTIGALGVNHTLTVANNVIFYDEPWCPGDKVQAEDRCNRIGSELPLNVYTLLSKDTIDEAVYKILNDKKDIASYIVDNKLDLRNNPELFEKLLGNKN